MLELLKARLAAGPVAKFIIYMTNGSRFILFGMTSLSGRIGTFTDGAGGEFFISEDNILGIELPTARSAPNSLLN